MRVEVESVARHSTLARTGDQQFIACRPVQIRSIIFSAIEREGVNLLKPIGDVVERMVVHASVIRGGLKNVSIHFRVPELGSIRTTVGRVGINALEISGKTVELAADHTSSRRSHFDRIVVLRIVQIRTVLPSVFSVRIRAMVAASFGRVVVVPQTRIILRHFQPVVFNRVVHECSIESAT